MAFSLANWQNFYVVVGSAAGALTGLQFVVLTLIAQARLASSMMEIRAFGTPTVIHFCSALLLSALMLVPWPSNATLAVCLGIAGALGSIYSLSIFRHARKTTYKPDFEDWIWYTALPLVAHLALVGAAVMLRWHVSLALCVVAADSMGFLTLGIRNSWDTVTYIAVHHTKGPTD